MQKALPLPAMAGGRAKPRPGEGGVRAVSAPPPVGKAMGQLRAGRSICPPAEGEGERLPLSVRLAVAVGVRGTARKPPCSGRAVVGASRPRRDGEEGPGRLRGSGTSPGAAPSGLREETRGLPGAPAAAGETPAVGFCMGLPLERAERFLGGCGPHTHTWARWVPAETRS